MCRVETTINNTQELETETRAKNTRLREILGCCGKLIVAYSGGVDSAFLAWSAQQVPGAHVRAVIADSPSLARKHLEDAIAFAHEHSIPLDIVATRELENPDYRRNDGMRCFHCKDELFAVLESYRQTHGFDAIAYGVNADDQGDFRPGQQAAKEHQVQAPLLDAGLNKSEIRELARCFGLRVWDKPASACLSSRIEYGRAVTREILNAIECGEDALRGLGFHQFRVRHHGEIVRIEIAPEELSKALTIPMTTELTSIFKRLGFKFVTLDLEGFRSGSMNQLLSPEALLRNRTEAGRS